MPMSLVDALGVLIAFLTVILLLSMVVTALVQSTQSIFRTRGRNLHKALKRIMVKDLGMDPVSAGSAAHKLLDGTLASLIKREPRSGWPARLLGPAVSWVEPEEIPDAARRAGLVPDAQGEAAAPGGEQIGPSDLTALQKGVEGMARPMEKRLGFTLRLISIGWAVLVAVAFQLSTFDLLRDIWSGEKLREGMQQEALEILAGTGVEAEPAPAPAGDVDSESASPGDAESKSASPGDAESKSASPGDAESESASPGDAESEKTSPDELATALARLSPLSIELWGTPDFFCDHGLAGEDEQAHRWLSIEKLTGCKDGDLAAEHVVGVAVTAFLLTFGAPFWFKQLKLAVGLRDALKEQDEEKGEKGKANQGAGTT